MFQKIRAMSILTKDRARSRPRHYLRYSALFRNSGYDLTGTMTLPTEEDDQCPTL